ncbi:hypothetical protein [Kibdelosporangium aridum]|uniref:hypothetical protein n=1 Tax=Kibdelosporangium aridum TaxID=2030 RepID=UPI0035E8FD12
MEEIVGSLPSWYPTGMTTTKYESVLGLASKQMLAELADFHLFDHFSSQMGEVFFATQKQMLTFTTRSSQLLDDLKLTVDLIYKIKGMLKESKDANHNDNPKDEKTFNTVQGVLTNEPLRELLELRAEQYGDENILLVDLQREMLLSRTVDNFLVYFSELAEACHKARPETLRSQGQVAVQDVLNFSNIDDFIVWITEKKISDLSYKGFDEVEDYFQRCFGLTPVDNPEVRRVIKRGIAVRNIFVHRRGVVDEKFIHLTQSAASLRGCRYKLSAEEAAEVSIAACRTVASLDKKAVAKFTLPSPSRPLVNLPDCKHD